MVRHLNDDLPSHSPHVVLSAEQFDKLVELLTPGYELAKAYLEQQAATATAPVPVVVEKNDPPAPVASEDEGSNAADQD